MGHDMMTPAKQQQLQAAFDVDMHRPTQGVASMCFDDDDRLKQTGTVWTASAHIITAIIGSSVLSLA